MAILEKRGLPSFALSYKLSVCVPICHCSATDFNTSQAHSEPQGHIMLLESGKWSIWQRQFTVKKYLSMLNDTESCSRLHPDTVAFDMATDQTPILLLWVPFWTILTKAYGNSLPCFLPPPFNFYYFFFKIEEGRMIFFDLRQRRGKKKLFCSGFWLTQQTVFKI